MANYFTADTHFGHKNIIKYCNRPFDSIDEMNEVMIENWNRVVSSKDNVYHLGDFGFKDINLILSRLNGNIHLIHGNHDSSAVKRNRRFITSSSIKEIKIDGIKTVLHHYSMRVWNASFHGSYHLFGHSHGMLPSYGLSFDVGVDAWNFMPISEGQIIEKIKSLRKE